MQKVVLKINNVGLVRKADVRIDGITVITGHNNSGKTTLGKVLYSVARPVCRLGDDYERDSLLYAARKLDELSLGLRLQNIETENSDTAFFSLMNGDYRKINSSDEMLSFINKLIEEAEEISWTTFNQNLPGDIQNKSPINRISIENDHSSLDKENFLTAVSSIKKRLSENRLSEFLGGQIFRTLNAEFREQLDPIRDEKAMASFSIEDEEGNKLYNLTSHRNHGMSSSFHVKLNSAFSTVSFIDDPYVIDDVSDDRFNNRPSSLGHRDYLREQLSACHEEKTVLEEMENKARLETALREIGKVLPGTYQFTQKTDYYIESGKKYNLANLATGSKVFSVLKILLEYGQLGENGLLILDEPEAHLHPDWINQMAQLLVILKKTLNISIVVATQSVNMVLALEAYSTMHDVRESFALYMPDSAVEDDSGMVTFTEMKDSRPVYNHLTAGYEEAFHILQAAIDTKGEK